MPWFTPSLDPRTTSPSAVWEKVVELVNDDPVLGFDRSPKDRALRQLLETLSPQEMGEVLHVGVQRAHERGSDHRTMPVVLHVLMDLHLGSGFLPEMVYKMAHGIPLSEQRDVWQQVLGHSHAPLMVEHVLHDLPRMGLPEPVIKCVVEGVHPRDAGWLLSAHRLPMESVDLLARHLNPAQQDHLVHGGRLAMHLPTERLALLLRHVDDDQLGELLAVTGRLHDQDRTSALDRIVTAVGPQRLSTVMTQAQEAQQARSPGSAPPAWTVILNDHLHRRPPTVSMDDLIQEAQELQALGAAPSAPSTGPASTPRHP